MYVEIYKKFGHFSVHAQTPISALGGQLHFSASSESMCGHSFIYPLWKCLGQESCVHQNTCNTLDQSKCLRAHTGLALS